MCQQGNPHHENSQPAPQHRANGGPFPWHLGAHDAHCHPTDTMASLASIPAMRARTLTIMATRSQDQHLVEGAAADLGIPVDRRGLEGPWGEGGCRVVPSFGWHPWFSHQLYDDTASASHLTYDPAAHQGSEHAAKRAHYQAVLSPPPSDEAFLASLPVPTALSAFVASTRARLAAHPHSLVGEIGLDKAFRLPDRWDPQAAELRDDGLTPGGREGRRLRPQRVGVAHQQAVATAQLRLAGDVGRPVSVHGVQAHGVLFQTVAACWKGMEKEVVSRRQRKLVAPGAEDDDDDDDDQESQAERGGGGGGGKPYPPRICLHSFSGTVEFLKQWLHPAIPASIYFSFSTAVNLGTPGGRGRFADVVRAVPADRVLVESDLHVAGERMDAALEDMYRFVCEVKGWALDEGVARLGRNYEAFVFG